jgi:DNA (cytosine-5)-methyltransferase 1
MSHLGSMSFCDDLEDLGYTVGAAVLPAVSVGADHIRNRLYFVGDANQYGKSNCEIHAKAQRMPGDRRQSVRMGPPDGIPRRMAIRGFGNAIVPQVAAEFIGAYLDISDDNL